MSTDYKPGTAALILIRGEDAPVRAMRGHACWLVPGRGTDFPKERDVVGVKPLVVLDLDSDLMRRFMTFGHEMCSVSRDLRDEIEEQTKPPRIDEPGQWGVVRDHRGQEYVRESAVASFPWNPIGKKLNVTWAQIIDPTLIREGLS